MAYDSLSYEIKERLPEWWKHDAILEPINRYSQELIRDLVGGLLGNFGAVQPFQVWKTLPTEYSWTHTYQPHDDFLKYPDGGTAPLFMNEHQPIYAYFPNSKRNCHGMIHLQLQGNAQGLKQSIKTLTIKNADQVISIHDISTTTDIKIFTEDGSILIDDEQRNDLVEGKFYKIYSQPKNTNYKQVNIEDENKTTYISIESDTPVNFELQTKLIHPIYVTEQNIRVHTVSAFPIEWIKLYGFYCHDFNDKQEWRFLWEKHYRKNERVVYDRITKQFDCETFYIQVKLYGIGGIFTYGFPQEELATNPAFQTNQNLDKWGKIYSMPRRYYKTHILEDEEPYTYPPYYNYSIEQDYWYEERLTNEYRHNDDAINAALVKDTELNNIAILQCIDPRIEDIFVYTETIKNDIDYNRQTNVIYPTSLSENGEGVTWQTPHEAANSNATGTKILLKPQGSESFNEKENQTKILTINFDDIPPLPKNIKIKGLELQLNGLTDIHSDSLSLDDRSQLLLPTVYTKRNGETIKVIDNILINNEVQYWEKGKGVYKIGGPNDLFNMEEIKREQIQDGMVFQIGLTNYNTFLKANIFLYSIQLIIYYEIMQDSYDMTVNLNRKQIVLDDPEQQDISMTINFENTGQVPIINKNVYIATSTGIDITNTTFPTFDLDVEEKFTIGETDIDEIAITPTIYEYLKIGEDSIIEKTVNTSTNKNVSFYCKTNNYAIIEVYINEEKVETIDLRSSLWKKYSYQANDIDEEISLKIKILEAPNDVFIKNPSEWDIDSPEIVEEVKTGYYDIIVFCEEKSIQNTILIKQTEA